MGRHDLERQRGMENLKINVIRMVRDITVDNSLKEEKHGEKY